MGLILEQNALNSNSKILKAYTAGQTNKASLQLRQCLNVSWQLLLYWATETKLDRQIIGQLFLGSFQIVGVKQYLIRREAWNRQLNFSASTATPDSCTMIWHFYRLEGNRPANMGIGRNGG